MDSEFMLQVQSVIALKALPLYQNATWEELARVAREVFDACDKEQRQHWRDVNQLKWDFHEARTAFVVSKRKMADLVTQDSNPTRALENFEKFERDYAAAGYLIASENGCYRMGDVEGLKFFYSQWLKHGKRFPNKPS